jgi:hypothetical protein
MHKSRMLDTYSAGKAAKNTSLNYDTEIKKLFAFLHE